MTREEAIKILADLTDNFFLHTWEEQYKALHMAIEALKAEPTGDLISRADAIKAIDYVLERTESNIHIRGVKKARLKDAIKALPAEAVQTDLVQRSDVLEIISDAQDGSGSTYNILQPVFVKVNNLPSCHRCDECDEQFYQQLLEKEMIKLPQEYVTVVHCKDCRWWQDDYMGKWCSRLSGVHSTNADDFCSWGERRSNRGEEVNGFKSVGQAWNTSQGRWEK